MNRLDGALPLRQVEALDQGVAASVAPVRTTTMTAGIFSIGALLLMSIGIYGVLAFGVRQRTQEIGIRMSLGATASQVRLGVLRQVLPVLGLGLSAGLIGAVVLGLALSSVLFGTNPIDLPVYLAIVTVVAVTVMMAALLPAHRAATLDPIKALRHD
jgi:ABC-type antimicrobial peptide transport system permease subunit